jgi:hypothetical protein
MKKQQKKEEERETFSAAIQEFSFCTLSTGMQKMRHFSCKVGFVRR